MKTKIIGKISAVLIMTLMIGGAFGSLFGAIEIAEAGFGDVVHIINTPSGGPKGLTWDGTYLWNTDWYDEKIYKVNPSDGSILDSFDTYHFFPTGLTWDGTYLYNADSGGDQIYWYDPSDGSMIDHFWAPGGSPQGLTWDGTYLWNADSSDDKIYKINPSDGSIINSFDSPGNSPTGLTWDGTYLWNADGAEDKIYKINPSDGSIINSFTSPGTHPMGLAWDGTYLWNTDWNEEKIYKIDVTENQPPIPLGEAVDNTDLTWSTGGDKDWFGQDQISYYDGDAAQSGDIDDSENSWIKTTVTGPGELKFYWKVSSEGNYDYLRFYIDDSEQTKISGERSWQQKIYSISSGSHEVMWKYTKDESVSDGSDCGWLDKVWWTPQQNEDWDISWSYPSSDDNFEIEMYEPYEIVLTVTNIGSNIQDFNYGLDCTSTIYYDVFDIQITPSWDLEESSNCLVNWNSYSFGTPLTDSIDPGQTKTYVFRITGHWNWLPERDITGLFTDYLMNGLSGLSKPISGINFLKYIAELLFETAPIVQYHYCGIGDSDPSSTGSIKVWTTRAKNAALEGSLYNGAVLGGFDTVLGVAALIVPPAAVIAFVAEAGILVSAQDLYNKAVDPDSNFTDIVNPYPPYLLEFEFGKGYSSYYDVAELCINQPSFSKACAKSYAKYLGALETNSSYWATIQFSATKYYMQKLANITKDAYSMFEEIFPDFPPLTPENISDIRNYLYQNGLPEIEVDILKYHGFTNNQIDAIVQNLLSVDDNYYYRAIDDFPQVYANFSLVLESSLEHYSEAPTGSLITEIEAEPHVLSFSTPPDILTCYAEFQNVSDLTGYQITSALLNNQIEPLSISPSPGDYDNDGIPDITIEYSGSELIQILQEGKNLLAILGNVTLPSLDTSMYAGVTLITVDGEAPYPPAKPSGPSNGVTRKDYLYTTSTTDPENSQVYYMFDWGDGNFSDRLDPYDSGTEISASHTWTAPGTYNITVKAWDIHGHDSEWSDPLEVDIEERNPAFSVNPTNLSFSKKRLVRETKTITIYNTGNTDLYWDIQNIDGDWITSINPTSGSLSPEGSTTVSVTVGAPLFLGDYYGQFTVHCHDSCLEYIEDQIVNVHLKVNPWIPWPKGKLVRPDDYDHDTPSDWIDKGDACDEYPWRTYAVYKEEENGWSDPLILTMNEPITIKGFKIRARNERCLKKMKVTFYNGSDSIPKWENTYTWWPHLRYKWVDFNGGGYEVDRVEIKFFVDGWKGFKRHNAKVYGFYFWQVPGDGDEEELVSHADAGGPYQGGVNQFVSFDSSGSIVIDGAIVNDTWDFGDGTYGYDMLVDHVYTTVGTYNVELTITDDNGNTYTDTTKATITTSGGDSDDYGSACFLAGTNITMANGSYKNIENVTEEDTVLAYNLTTGEFVNATVTKKYNHTKDEMPGYYIVINNKIRVTPNHLLLVNGTLMRAEDVRVNDTIQAEDVVVNDTLLGANGSNVTITSVYQVTKQVPTYNLGLNSTTLMYFAEDIAAHHLKPPYIVLKPLNNDDDNNLHSAPVNGQEQQNSQQNSDVTPNIGNLNLPPVADMNILSSKGTTITFDASGSYDPDGAIVSYE